jgi:hypothetical protein
MTPELEEMIWVAQRHPEVDEPDALATDRARLALMEYVSETSRSRRRSLPWLAAAVATAAVAAVAVVVAGAGSGDASHPQPAAAAPGIGAQGPVQTGQSTDVLVRLAHSVARSSAMPGNATLVHRSTHDYGGTPSQDKRFDGYDLFEDNGDYYYGDTLAQLRQAASDPSQAGKSEGAPITAAAKAANTNGTTAAFAIYNAGVIPAHAIPNAASMTTSSDVTLADGRKITAFQRDNLLWVDIVQALQGGAGRPDVRAGALLAASILPDVTVTHIELDGQQVLQITNTQFPRGYADTDDVNATTGVMIHSHGGAMDGSTATDEAADVTYDASRVTAPSLTPAH